MWTSISWCRWLDVTIDYWYDGWFTMWRWMTWCRYWLDATWSESCDRWWLMWPLRADVTVDDWCLVATILPLTSFCCVALRHSLYSWALCFLDATLHGEQLLIFFSFILLFSSFFFFFGALRDDGIVVSWYRDVSFLNNRQNRPAELMAKFLDVKLKGEKGMSDDDVEGVLDKVMVLFR